MNRIRTLLSPLSRCRTRCCRIWRDRRGMAAIEFALIAPLLIGGVFGEFTLCESFTINRKVAVAARTITDLVARQTNCVTASDVTTLLNASAQIAAPYPTANMTVTVSELATDANSNTTVTWSQTLHGTALTSGASFSPGTGIVQPSSSIIYGSVTYTYTPVVGYILSGPIRVSNTFYMYPRNSSVIYLSSTCST